MGNDALSSARRIRQPITGNGDIMTAFDGITYQKGASVLGMFETYVGEETFQQGMRAYMRKHAHGNATAADRIDAITKAADKGEGFKKAFNSFLDQSGVPYVQTQLCRRTAKPNAGSARVVTCRCAAVATASGSGGAGVRALWHDRRKQGRLRNA